MKRRELLALPFATFLAEERSPHQALDEYFLPILSGYLWNARRTSPSFAVCDFAGGTILPGAVGKSGKTYDSVTRMLPALASWVAAGRQPSTFSVGGESLDLNSVLIETFRNAFDPGHPDYWLPAPSDRQNQRQVEASIVAWSVWLLGGKVLDRLSPQQRARIQDWLASCTQVPVRRNNWAWFTAVNHAARIALSERWKEFSGDENWMIEDLKALNRMAAPGDDGWYSDSLEEPVYDYYNFWVFASHFLYWNRMVGRRYRPWSSLFCMRLKRFLKTVPHFFGANGSHVLFGRSLIYRWAVLAPLVLAYLEDMWPHSRGLLRRIVRGNLEYLWKLGAYDEKHGKLRETLSPFGTRAVCESYIDNGHPYWGMQAFAVFLIPQDDRFWSDNEDPLPVERGDFEIRLDGPRMMLVGSKDTGQVRWLHAVTGHHEPHYRDKYTKFSYSSHFPFNIIQSDLHSAWDCALTFCDTRTGATTGRGGVTKGELLRHGVRIQWWARLGNLRFEVTTRIRVSGEFEHRRHAIVSPPEALGAGIEIMDASNALGLEQGEFYEGESRGLSQWIRARRSGYVIWSHNASGFDSLEPVESFGESGRRDVNIVYPRMVVNVLRAALRSRTTTLASLHYASPRPLSEDEVSRRGMRMF